MNPGHRNSRTPALLPLTCTESEVAFLVPISLISSNTMAKVQGLPQSLITQYPIHTRFTEHAIRWTLQQLQFGKRASAEAVRTKLFTKARIRQTRWVSGPLAGTTSYDITIKGEKRCGTRSEEVLALDLATFKGALLPYTSRGCVHKERFTAEVKVGGNGEPGIICIDRFIHAGKRPDPLASARTAPLFVSPFPLLRIEVETTSPTDLKSVRAGKCSWNELYRNGIDLSAPVHQVLSRHFGNSRLARNGVTESARRVLAQVCAEMYPSGLYLQTSLSCSPKDLPAEAS